MSGLIAAPYTLFNSDFSLNLKAVPLIAEHLVRQKVNGAFVVGSTGEYASLTQEERIALAEAWRKAAGSQLKLIVHVGHNSVYDCRALARHAESIGADAIAALMPSYFRPRTIEATVEFCRQIAEAAPHTPFYYYHIPDMTGVNLEMAALLPEIRRRVPTFRGIKFTHSNMMDYSLTVADAGPDYDILFGRDEILLAGLAMGARGAVGSTYNYSAELYHKLLAAHAGAHTAEAREHQVYIQRAILPLLKHGGHPAGKAIMALVGIDCGPARPPFSALAGEKLAALRADLEAIGFFEAVNAGSRKRTPSAGNVDNRHSGHSGQTIASQK